jgi:hypothetical protein
MQTCGGISIACSLKVLVTNHIEKRDEDMKPGAQGTAILTQTLDDKGALLRHHDGVLATMMTKKSENDNDDKSAHTSPFQFDSARTKIIRPSTRSTLQR